MYDALNDDRTVAAVLKMAASDLMVKNLESSSPVVVAVSNSLVGHRQWQH